MLSDAQLSREREVRWLHAVLPPCIQYVRELAWQESFFPSPRCLFGATVWAATICRDTHAAVRIFYTLCDPEGHDGWHPCPPEDLHKHGGRLILASSIGASRKPEPFVPTINPEALAKWRANQIAAAEYWARFKACNPQQTNWPGLIMPEPPKPRRWFSWGS